MDPKPTLYTINRRTGETDDEFATRVANDTQTMDVRITQVHWSTDRSKVDIWFQERSNNNVHDMQ